jgi:hypothetical protein
VERTIAWLVGFRYLQVRYGRHAAYLYDAGDSDHRTAAPVQARVTGTGCTATDQPYVEYTFTNQTGGDVVVAFSYSLDGAPYTDPLGRSAAGHGGTYTDRFEFSPGTEGTVTIRAVVEGDAPATVTADPVLLPACEPAPPPPPPPSCDCEGRQVTVTNASKYLLPGKELNQLGITCFNIRFLNFSGEYVVSASGPEAALKKLFDRD